MTMRQAAVFLTTCLLGLAGTVTAQVSFDPLPGQTFIHQETFDQNTPAGFNLSPTFVPYPNSPAWKVPGASQVVDGMLSSSNKNGAAQFDVSSLFGPFGADLKNSSVALYMRLWADGKSAQPRVSIGFMNFAAEEALPDMTLAQYLGMYVRNSSNPMIGWGGKKDMDNQADGVGLQKQGIVTEGWHDYAVLLEGNGTTVNVSAFYKAIDEVAWTAVADAAGKTTIDSTMGFDSRKVFFWTRDNANIWKIDEFAVSKVVKNVSFAPLPGQAFIQQETFDEAAPAGFNLSPTFVPYPNSPAWKVPGASQVVDGMLSSSNKNGAAEFDASSLFGPFGADLKNSSVALYMRLWTDVKSASPRVSVGFMNFAAEEALPDTALARYLGIYVRNSSNPMIGWGGKNDMDNQADGTGLQKQGLVTEGWHDYAVLLEGNGTTVNVSAFYKAIDEVAWTAVADTTGKTTIDTTMGFDSRKVFFWTRDNANIWKIDEFAMSTCYLTVDDMESYNLLNSIWYTYIDGYGYTEPAPGFHGNGSGSMVDTSSAIKHADANSLALSYNNTGAFINAFDEVIPALYSEVTRTFEEPKDWTAKGVDTLSIWFRGLPANDPQPLYVVIEDSAGKKATVINENPAAVRNAMFTEWPITLTGIAGVNMTSVKKLTLGVGDKAATQAGGKGTVYFDDVGLYKGL